VSTPTAQQLEERALAFLQRRDSAGWSDADQAELDAWIEASTANRVTWLRMQHGWQRTDRLASLRTPALLRPAASALRAGPRRTMALAASVCLAVLVVAFLALQGFGPTEKRYSTEIGGHQSVPLKDGSRVELNTDTRLRAAVTEQVREVWLEKGEAYFDIAKDPHKPFIVNAGERRIVVLGTRFSVRRDGARVEVAVAEGKVRVESPNAQKPIPPAVVTGGDVVIAEAESVLVAAASLQRVESEHAWRHGLLVFDRATLADAAREFNRYNRKQLVLADDVAGDTRISGSFDATNVEAFSRLLQRAYGLNIADEGERIAILN
jgi:transmembrane sensor